MTKEYSKMHKYLRRHSEAISCWAKTAVKHHLLISLFFFVLFLGENSAGIENALVMMCKSVMISAVLNLVLAITFAIIVGTLKASSIVLGKSTKYRIPCPYKNRTFFYLLGNISTHIVLFGLATFLLRSIR